MGKRDGRGERHIQIEQVKNISYRKGRDGGNPI
jgi:hypothetical protein